MKDKKNGKTQMVLWMYEKLLSERKISKEEVLAKENISSITFKRYIYDIKDYLAINSSEYALVYTRRYKLYKLVHRENVGMGKENLQGSANAIGEPKFAYHQ
jgi:DNA-binding CsgD family transcriptional regulator